MFLDASVIVAVINQEPDADALTEQLTQAARVCYVSPMVRFEAVQAIARSTAAMRGVSVTAKTLSIARELVDGLIVQLDAEDIDISAEIGSAAIDASMTYGKVVGHPARLNLGDCFAYACAKALKVPLLYQGDDFARTDLA